MTKGRVRSVTRSFTPLDRGRGRLAVACLMVMALFALFGWRLASLTTAGDQPLSPPVQTQKAERGKVVDRNGLPLATNLRQPSIYADPAEVLDPAEAAAVLAPILNQPADTLQERLSRRGRFIWLARHVHPTVVAQLLEAGVPGVDFKWETRRLQPYGPLTGHVIGYTDIDGRGIAGMESYFNESLAAGETVQSSLDIRLQQSVRDNLAKAMDKFQAIGAAAVVMNARSGEIHAMVSLPEFDSLNPGAAETEALFNRPVLGVYETGSVFKLLTAAMAFESGRITPETVYDASKPLMFGGFKIDDYHGEYRPLTVAEIIKFSSNIGTAQMALDVGTAEQKAFIERLGLTRRLDIELPERGAPLIPNPWRKINTITISYGHGIAISPLHLAAAIATLANDGVRLSPTLVRRDGLPKGRRVFAKQTAEMVQKLMRLVVTDGTGTKADVPGYWVGGKTGTADKPKGGRYAQDARVSSFVGAFPMHDPEWVIYVMLDEPKGTKDTWGFATGGWTAAPVVGEIVKAIARLEAIPPDEDPAIGELLETKRLAGMGLVSGE